jgi:hypothetical protein
MCGSSEERFLSAANKFKQQRVAATAAKEGQDSRKRDAVVGAGGYASDWIYLMGPSGEFLDLFSKGGSEGDVAMSVQAALGNL